MSTTYKELIRILGSRMEQKKVSRVADTVLQWAGATPEDLTADKLVGALDFVSGSLEIHIPNQSDLQTVMSQLRNIS